MSEFIVHGIPGSPYVRAALLVLEEKGLAWRLAPLALGGNHSPDYRALQPFGKIPAFEHDGMRFYETQAMLRYVERIAPEPALVPADPRQALRMDQLIGITDDYVRSRVSGELSFPLAVAPRFGLPVDREAALAAIPEAKRAVDEVARLLGDQVYLAGETLSLADLMLVPHLAFLQAYAEGRALLAPHAGLTGWIARMEARPSMAATRWERLVEMAAAPATEAA